MTLPVYTTKIGLETALTGALRFDVSKFDGADVFANAFTNFFTGAFDNVTNDVDGEAGATITRGRDQVLGPIQAGTFDFTLGDPQNQPGFYDPNNPSSPLAALSPGLVPMRPVVVQATVGGITYPRFYGFIRTATYNPDTRSCAIHAEDFFLWLAREKPTVATLSTTTTQAVIAALLDASQWNDPNMRVLSAYGDAIASYSLADGTRFASSLIRDLLDACRGLVFIDKSGRLVFEDRNARSRRTSSLVSFASNELAVARSGGASRVDLDQILNEITVTGSDSVPYTKQNLPSQRDYGIGEIGDVNSDLIAPSLSEAIAQWEVALATQLQSPYVAVVDPDALDRVFSIDLQDRLTISGGSSAGDYHLERIVERFGYQAGQFGAELTLSMRGLSGLVFDHSVFDGADIFVA